MLWGDYTSSGMYHLIIAAMYTVFYNLITVYDKLFVQEN